VRPTTHTSLPAYADITYRDECKFVVHRLNIDMVVDITAVENPAYAGSAYNSSEESDGELVAGLEALSTGL
jgi:hypothetical protein